jgi:large subunit ribosomal protein L15
MVLRKKKKVRKQRGTRTYGRGCSKRGRGSGERGGTGLSGGHKQKWSYILSHAPNHFGKRGFVRPARIREDIQTINVGDIDEALDHLVETGIAQREGENYRIDIEKLGIFKVLGKGRVTHRIEVLAREFSETAKQKLEEAGGKAISGEGDGGASEAEV